MSLKKFSYSFYLIYFSKYIGDAGDGQKEIIIYLIIIITSLHCLPSMTPDKLIVLQKMGKPRSEVISTAARRILQFFQVNNER